MAQYLCNEVHAGLHIAYTHTFTVIAHAYLLQGTLNICTLLPPGGSSWVMNISYLVSDELVEYLVAMLGRACRRIL